MKSFWRDGLSVSETKKSSVVIIFIITSIFALYQYHINGDITGNLLYFLIALLSVVGGVNIAEKYKEVAIEKERVKSEIDKLRSKF